MAARDGIFRDGLYSFECEACGQPAKARRAHARACSNTCAARLRRRRSQQCLGGDGAPAEFRFYISRRKLEASLAAFDEGKAGAPEPLVVGFDRDGRGPELARLRIEMTDQDDGGLVCSVTAPYNPFHESRRAEPASDSE